VLPLVGRSFICAEPRRHRLALLLEPYTKKQVNVLVGFHWVVQITRQQLVNGTTIISQTRVLLTNRKLLLLYLCTARPQGVGTQSVHFFWSGCLTSSGKFPTLRRSECHRCTHRSKTVVTKGIEPLTNGLLDQRSTD
jgi:hypothetical protein